MRETEKTHYRKFNSKYNIFYQQQETEQVKISSLNWIEAHNFVSQKKKALKMKKKFNIVYIQCLINMKYNLFLTFASENFNIWRFNCRME